MTTAQPSLPQIDLDSLPESVRGPVAALLELVRSLLSENRLLRDRLDLLVRRYFGGQKNEQVSAEQLNLLLSGFTQELLQAAATTTPVERRPAADAPRKSRPVRRGVPDHLPVRHSQVLIPDEVQAQPELFREIDRSTTRVMDYEPGRFVCDEIIRPRFVRTGSTPAEEPEVLAAPLPNRLIEKGLPGVGLLCHLVLSRFEDHLPFYRLEKAFEQRHDVHLSRQTMVGWIEVLAGWFEPVVGLMKQELLAGGYLQADETVIRYLDRDDPGKSHPGYFWVYGRPGHNVLFDWSTGRGAEHPRKFLEGYQGVLQCDGYGVYPSLGEALGQIELYFCVTHFRRKFVEAKDESPRAAWYLLQLRHLYDIERRLRERRAGPKLREAVRAAEARPIWERLRKAMTLHLQLPRVLPSSRLAQALRYGLERWEGLCRYVRNGRVEIDSNFIENAIRPTAVGKKNFLFVGHPEAGWRSAVMYSVLASCRSWRINPALYLQDVLSRLPDMLAKDLPNYTPAAWAKRHPEARVTLPK